MKGGFDVDILELSISSICHHVMGAEDNSFVYELLRQYSSVKSFKTACMVVGKKCMEEFLLITEMLEKNGLSGDKVTALKNAYGQ